MKFSEHFGIEVTSETEWFDPLLNLDTKLFVDPFLIYDQEFEEFVGSHDAITAFFNQQFESIAETKGNRSSRVWKRTETNLLFPEIEELCLGYTSEGTGGLGSGKEVARAIASAIWRAIDTGVHDLRHFEEVQLFQKGINRDRISDATALMLFDRFAKYTERQTQNIPRKNKTFKRTRYCTEKKRWIAHTFQLPINPFNNKAVLLCPKIYLRPDPTINADSFWDYVRFNEPVILLSEFCEDIVSHLNKEEIIRIATRYPDARDRYIDFQEDEGAAPYDYARDPKGLIEWYSKTRDWVGRENPKLGFSDEETFFNFVQAMIETFRNYVQNQGGWRLLWNDNHSPRSEEAAQWLFQGIILHSCRQNNIDLSREANIGRGPVDYKASVGFAQRALIELKLARNTKFWNGLEKQLPKYLEAEGIRCGVFVVIAFNDKDLEKTIDIEKRTKAISTKVGYDISSIVIDASRDKPSASKL